MKPFACLVAFFCCLLHLCDAASVAANFTNSSTIPVTAATYTATGNDVQLSLGFAPPVGTNLTVVKNTGLPFINGQFSNLAHGEVVNLAYGGKSYRFVANYTAAHQDLWKRDLSPDALPPYHAWLKQ